MKDKTVSELAAIIRQDWKAPYFGAVPYLRAMSEIHKIDIRQVNYGNETATGVVRYFLSNARQWKGDVARAVKAELKERAGIK